MSRKGKPIKVGQPSPTVQTHGRQKTHNEMMLPTAPLPAVMLSEDKPPYRVPLMAEIAALPPNGFKVVSTFSGCGGSCLGYRMAGFKVIWANEFVPAAQVSYRANAPDCHLDVRDVKQVQPEDILQKTGLKQGELDLFDGSPPCQAFSTAGKRQKGWGQAKKYEHGAKQCNEMLFGEYVRLLRGLMPKVFVAENVSGLVKGVAKGFFKEILRDLKASGYRVEARLLDAQWLGVPQMRQRIVFIGVRSDLNAAPAFPKPLPYRYSVRDALPYIGGLSTNLNFEERWVDSNRPAPSVLAGGGNEKGGMVSSPLVAPRDKRGGFGKEGRITDEPAPAVLAETAGNLWVEPESDITGYAVGAEWDKLKPGESVFYGGGRVSRPLDTPSNSVTGSGGSASLAGVCHPTERRKFTIAELKRICAFPDDFVLTGTYAQQWERLGNAVPPVMMKAIAEVIRDRILKTSS